MRQLAVVLAVLALSACGEPGKVRIVSEVGAQGYSTRDVSLPSLDDLDAVRGGAAELFGGATVDMNVTTLPLDRGGSRDTFVDGAETPAAGWVASGGVAVATDFDSLSMFTIYAHLEAAVDFFSRVGVVDEALTPLPVYYNPTLKGGGDALDKSTDNAAFFSYLDAFAVLRQNVLQDIPLGMNPGVLTHEYGHRVLYYEVWGGKLFERLGELTAEPPGFEQTFNLLRSLDEGLADFWATSATQDPRYLDSSLPEEVADSRAVDELHVMSASWLGGTQPAVDGTYIPYALGNVLASSLWDIEQTVGLEITLRAALTAERQLGQQLDDQIAYAVGDWETAFIIALPSADRAAACDTFAITYEPAFGRFAGVCP